MSKKKQQTRQPDKRTITGAVKVKTLKDEWTDFKPWLYYHLHTKKFRIKSLRGATIQPVRRVRSKTTGKPTPKYMVKLIGIGQLIHGKKTKDGYRAGDLIKVHEDEIFSYRRGD